ncbi:MAG: DUF4956 domain-containing protein [Butyrivibrio sp.]|nr:DUF4956 domain-containing protein [Butyrivibrio sp.]
MKEQLIKVLNANATTLTMSQIIMNFAIALVIGLVIYISYRTSHTRVVYSARFNVSLLMLTLITTLIMSVIGNNVALSLGMVGALSIVRFRTAVKDPRDTAYIFWCISIGICCGVAEYRVAVAGSAVIFVLLVVMGLVQDNNRYLLVVRGNREQEKNIFDAVANYYDGKAAVRVNNSTSETTEIIFELSQSIINKVAKQEESISDRLYRIDGVKSVNVVMQNDEMR